MNPYKVFTKNEINLISEVTKIENKEYTKEETKLVQNDIFDEIFLKSFKNGDMDRTRMKFMGILEKLNKNMA